MGAWVPLADGPFSFSFNVDASDNIGVRSALVGSTVVLGPLPPETDVRPYWELSFDEPAPPRVRITITEYLAGQNQQGNIYREARFESVKLPGGELYNAAAPSPAETFPDNTGVTAFAPSPLVIEDDSGDGGVAAVRYYPTTATGDGIRVDQSFRMLIEVWGSNAPGGFWTNFVLTNETTPVVEEPEL